MFEEISYAIILGKPAIFWGGLATFILLVITLSIGFAIHKNLVNIDFKWHKIFAFTTALFAVVHAGLALAHYLFI
ncbi:MAG: hypothetical protein WCW44_02255 [archaeon]|jgi:cytochrome b561